MDKTEDDKWHIGKHSQYVYNNYECADESGGDGVIVAEINFDTFEIKNLNKPVEGFETEGDLASRECEHYYDSKMGR